MNRGAILVGPAAAGGFRHCLLQTSKLQASLALRAMAAVWTFGEGNVGKFQTFSEHRRDAYGTLGLGSAWLSGVALSWRQSIIGVPPVPVAGTERLKRSRSSISFKIFVMLVLFASPHAHGLQASIWDAP